MKTQLFALSAPWPVPSVRGTRALSLAAGLALAGLLAGVPAAAQPLIRPGSQEVHVFAGGLLADDLTDTKISGRTPQLDDSVTFGARYGYNFTATWGAELSLGYTPGSVTRGAEGDIDLDVTTLELNVVRHFHPILPRLVPYFTMGAGYAWADLDRSIRGTVGSTNVSVGGEDGFTANAGAGLKYFVTDQVILRCDLRYRYVDQLADRFEQSLDAVEGTIGIGWIF